MATKPKNIPKEPKTKSSIRLSATSKDLRIWLADFLGISQTAVIELAVRELADKWGYYKDQK